MPSPSNGIGAENTRARAISYAEAGVDIEAGDRAVALMRPAIAGASQLANRFGSFGAAVASPGSNMLLVSSADGVGTKVCLARTDEECAGLGRDLVHHCINDILTSGARPLFFLDYLAFAKLRPTRAAAMVRGMADACAARGCALIGGETAELPDLYRDDVFDMAGFIVGTVDREKMLTGSSVEPDDLLVGLPSAGLHTNGFTLARKLLHDRLDEPLATLVPESGALAQATTVREALLFEHRCYLDDIAPLLEQGLIRGIAHVTGGGLPGNVPRMLPDGLSARFDPASWRVPGIFKVLSDFGLERRELYRAFNMGIGMVLACAPAHASRVLSAISGAVEIGSVEQQLGADRVVGLW